MSDIMWWLEDQAKCADYDEHAERFDEAAQKIVDQKAEIERLRDELASTVDELQGERWDNDLKDKEIERLREALREIRDVTFDYDGGKVNRIAREALR